MLCYNELHNYVYNYKLVLFFIFIQCILRTCFINYSHKIIINITQLHSLNVLFHHTRKNDVVSIILALANQLEQLNGEFVNGFNVQID